MNLFQRLISIIILVANAGMTEATSISLAEQRLSEELAASINVGHAVNLGEPEQTFLGIFLEAQAKKSRGGIILLHDVNNHADWPDVISPLRKAMAKHGWHTLSVQLPPISNSQSTSTNTAQWEALEQEVHRRVRVAIEYCQNKRIYNLVLLGHQFGAVMASRYTTAQASEKALSALVTINLYSPTNLLWLDANSQRDLTTNVKIAFLDIVPSQSPDFVLEQAKIRKLAMSNPGHDKYKQIPIIGTDYSFIGVEKTLISRIQSWLTKLAPSMEVQIASPAQKKADISQ